MHQMMCTELEFHDHTGMKQFWDDAFNFIYRCSEFDHTYMANIFKRVQNLETNFSAQLETGANDPPYSGLKVS